MANYQPCGAVLNIVSSKAATLLAWLLTNKAYDLVPFAEAKSGGKGNSFTTSTITCNYDTKLFTVIARTYLINFYP